MGRKMSNDQLAVYKGDELLFIGTATECAEELGVKRETIFFYLSPAYQRRVAQRKGKYNSTEVIKLDD